MAFAESQFYRVEVEAIWRHGKLKSKTTADNSSRFLALGPRLAANLRMGISRQLRTQLLPRRLLQNVAGRLCTK